MAALVDFSEQMPLDMHWRLAFRRGAPHLRSVLGRELGLRVTPELRFEYDTMPDQARRVDELLRQGAPPPKSDEEDQ